MGIRIQAQNFFFCLLAGAATYAHASVALLMEEHYGEFVALNPTGHAAVYFNHICADTPTMLRRCHDGEYGVVISRYHKIDGYDWLAIPLVGYLYAVDSPRKSGVRCGESRGTGPIPAELTMTFRPMGSDPSTMRRRFQDKFSFYEGS
jgi:hypothetical protein